MIFIDTDVAIELRDDVTVAGPRLAAITAKPVMSLITRIELEAGVERDSVAAPARRALLNVMLQTIDVIVLTSADVEAYGRIVADLGFDRRRILDRLIAAQVLTNRAALITRNLADFRDIRSLTLIPW